MFRRLCENAAQRSSFSKSESAFKTRDDCCLPEVSSAVERLLIRAGLVCVRSAALTSPFHNSFHSEAESVTGFLAIVFHGTRRKTTLPARHPRQSLASPRISFRKWVPGSRRCECACTRLSATPKVMTKRGGVDRADGVPQALARSQFRCQR